MEGIEVQPPLDFESLNRRLSRGRVKPCPVSSKHPFIGVYLLVQSNHSGGAGHDSHD
jgi:hypothetical protein